MGASARARDGWDRAVVAYARQHRPLVIEALALGVWTVPEIRRYTGLTARQVVNVIGVLKRLGVVAVVERGKFHVDRSERVVCRYRLVESRPLT